MTSKKERICKYCTARNLCAFHGNPESVKGTTPLGAVLCIHNVCPAGRKAGRDAMGNPESKVTLEDGEITKATPFEAGEKTFGIAGWFVEKSGNVLTRNNEGKYRRSGQNVKNTKK